MGGCYGLLQNLWGCSMLESSNARYWETLTNKFTLIFLLLFFFQPLRVTSDSTECWIINGWMSKTLLFLKSLQHYGCAPAPNVSVLPLNRSSAAFVQLSGAHCVCVIEALPPPPCFLMSCLFLAIWYSIVVNFTLDWRTINE